MLNDCSPFDTAVSQLESWPFCAFGSEIDDFPHTFWSCRIRLAH